MSLRLRNGMAFSIILILGLFPMSAVAGGGGGTNQVRDTVGLHRDGLWILRSSNDSACTGATLSIFVYGATTDTPLAMDPDGDGLDQVTVFRDTDGFGSFFVRANNDTGAQAATRVNFGATGDLPIAGNFDGAGGDEVGVYRPSTNRFFLNLSGGVVTFVIGTAGDLPIVGDWDGDGTDEVGVYRPSTSSFFTADANMAGATLTQRNLGASGDSPLTGDWDGDDTATIAVSRDEAGVGLATFFSNMTSGGVVDATLRFGAVGDTSVSGDWDGPTVDEDGCGPT